MKKYLPLVLRVKSILVPCTIKQQKKLVMRILLFLSFLSLLNLLVSNIFFADLKKILYCFIFPSTVSLSLPYHVGNVSLDRQREDSIRVSAHSVHVEEEALESVEEGIARNDADGGVLEKANLLTATIK